MSAKDDAVVSLSPDPLPLVTPLPGTLLVEYWLALAQQLFQVGRQVPADLEVLQTIVLPDPQLRLKFRDGSPVEFLDFRGAPDGATARSVFVTNEADIGNGRGVSLLLIDPCHPAVDVNKGQQIGQFSADLFRGWSWDPTQGQYVSFDEEWVGNVCDSPRPPGWRLQPGETFRMEIRLNPLQGLPLGNRLLNPAVIGGIGPAVTGPIAPPSGIVGWWPGDGDAEDIVGGNNGTLTGDATFAPGIVEQGFSLDGTGDFVLVPDNTSLNITGDVTVDLWAKRTVFGRTSVLIDKGANFVGAADRPDAYAMWFSQNDHVVAGFARTNGSLVFLVGPLITDSQFHHYAYVRSENTHNLFVDGVVVTPMPLPVYPEIPLGCPWQSERSDAIPIRQVSPLSSAGPSTNWKSSTEP